MLLTTHLHIDHPAVLFVALIEAVGRLVAPLLHVDALPVVAGELPLQARRHLHPLHPRSLDRTRVTLVVLNPGKINCMDSDKKRRFRRWTDCHAPVILAVIPHPRATVLVVEDHGRPVAEIHWAAILVDHIGVVAVKEGKRAETPDVHLPGWGCNLTQVAVLQLQN